MHHAAQVTRLAAPAHSWHLKHTRPSPKLRALHRGLAHVQSAGKTPAVRAVRPFSVARACRSAASRATLS
eukprot:9939345-Lingulodinium_polyedra.AAC.1